MADLSLVDQLLDRAGHVLDRHVGIDPVLVKKVDVVGAQPAQRALEHFADVFGPAVELAVASVEGEPELRRDDDLVPQRLERLTDDLLVVVGPVHLGGVEERHAVPVGLSQEVDHRRPVRGGAERLADPHAAQPQRRDLKPRTAECPLPCPWSSFFDVTVAAERNFWRPRGRRVPVPSVPVRNALQVHDPTRDGLRRRGSRPPASERTPGHEATATQVMLLPDSLPSTIGWHRPTRQCRSSDAAVVRSRFQGLPPRTTPNLGLS